MATTRTTGSWRRAEANAGTTCRTKQRKRLTELTDVAADNKVATTLVSAGGEWRREDFKAEERDEITCGKERISIYLYIAVSKIPSPFYRTIYVYINYKYAVQRRCHSVLTWKVMVNWSDGDSELKIEDCKNIYIEYIRTCKKILL